jgi:hypothetical protein
VTSASRTFEIRQAVRTKTPLWIALGGPSGGGKTLSALRLATGIAKVFGGKIGVIDTEAERARHYAPVTGAKADPPRTFDFMHVPFGAPFGSLDYLAAVEHCAANGVTVAIVDSFSHEHESIGGVLEQFEEELERLSKGDQGKAERVKMLAWKKPKMNRRRMINGMLQMPISIIGCFRTKDKLKLQRGQDPMHLGYMPITGDEMIFEFPTRCLLKPRSDGSPCLNTDEPGEKEWTRIPEQFRKLIAGDRSLDERIGEEMAKWAAGDSSSTPSPKPIANKLVARLLSMADGAPNAMERILARNLDDAGLTAAGMAIKGGAKFDEEFPPLPMEPTK